MAEKYHLNDRDESIPEMLQWKSDRIFHPTNFIRFIFKFNFLDFSFLDFFPIGFWK